MHPSLITPPMYDKPAERRTERNQRSHEEEAAAQEEQRMQDETCRRAEDELDAQGQWSQEERVASEADQSERSAAVPRKGGKRRKGDQTARAVEFHCIAPMLQEWG